MKCLFQEQKDVSATRKCEKERIKEFWSEIERDFGDEIPEYLKVLLNVNRFSTKAVLKTLDKEDVDALEESANTIFKGKMGEIYDININSDSKFKIVLGHKKLIMQLSNHCKENYCKPISASCNNDISKDNKKCTEANKKRKHETQKSVNFNLIEKDLNQKVKLAVTNTAIQINVSLPENSVKRLRNLIVVAKVSSTANDFECNVPCVMCNNTIVVFHKDGRWILSNFTRHIRLCLSKRRVQHCKSIKSFTRKHDNFSECDSQKKKIKNESLKLDYNVEANNATSESLEVKKNEPKHSHNYLLPTPSTGFNVINENQIDLTNLKQKPEFDLRDNLKDPKHPNKNTQGTRQAEAKQSLQGTSSQTVILKRDHSSDCLSPTENIQNKKVKLEIDEHDDTTTKLSELKKRKQNTLIRSILPIRQTRSKTFEEFQSELSNIKQEPRFDLKNNTKNPKNSHENTQKKIENLISPRVSNIMNRQRGLYKPSQNPSSSESFLEKKKNLS